MDLSVHLEMMATSYDYPYFKRRAALLWRVPASAVKRRLPDSCCHLLPVLLIGPSDGSCITTENPNVASRTCNAKGSICIPKHIQSLFPKDLRPGILVLDDLMRGCSEDQHVLDLFTKGSHRNDVTCIYLAQNLFPPGKYARTISPNTHYMVALKIPSDVVGVRNFAPQAYPGRVPFVMDKDATIQPYGYLLFDLHPSTPDLLRLRTNVLTHPTIVYQENKNNER